MQLKIDYKEEINTKTDQVYLLKTINFKPKKMSQIQKQI